ncbi:MAG: LptF/LptG family permease [Bdellovibrionales bacterium]
MDRLTTYLFRQLMLTLVFTAGAVSFVVLFTQLFRLLSLVIDNSGTALVFVELMALSIPTFLPLILPLAMGISTLFAYHKLSNDSELIVMHAAGISPLQQAKPAIIIGTVMLVACYVLTLSLTPAANRELVRLQYKVRDSYAALLSRPGNFNDLSDGLTFYAQKRGAGGVLEGILIHDTRDPETPVTIMADSGKIIDNSSQPQIAIFNGRRQELDRATGKLAEFSFGQYMLDLNMLRSMPGHRLPDPREQTIAELMSPTQDMLKRRASYKQLGAELHQRLASPMLALSFTLISLCAIYVGTFNRRGLALRIVLAALAIVVVQAAFMALNSLVPRIQELAILLYAAALLPIPVCLLLLKGEKNGAVPPIHRQNPLPKAGAAT